MSAAHATVLTKAAGRGAALRQRVTKLQTWREPTPRSVPSVATPSGSTPAAAVGRGSKLPGRHQGIPLSAAGRGRFRNPTKSRSGDESVEGHPFALGVTGSNNTLDSLAQIVDAQEHRNAHLNNNNNENNDEQNGNLKRVPRQDTSASSALSRSALSMDVLHRHAHRGNDRSRRRTNAYGTRLPSDVDEEEEGGYDSDTQGSSVNRQRRNARNSRNASIYSNGDDSESSRRVTAAGGGGGGGVGGRVVIPRHLDILGGRPSEGMTLPPAAEARIAESLRRQRVTQRLRPIQEFLDAAPPLPPPASRTSLPPRAVNMHGAVVVDGHVMADCHAEPFAWGDFTKAEEELPDGHWAQGFVGDVARAATTGKGGVFSGGQKSMLFGETLKVLAEISQQQASEDGDKDRLDGADRFADAEEDMRAEASA